MYQPLAPCTECRRHVRAVEARCPFCGTSRAGAGPIEVSPTVRMSRAAAVAAAFVIAGCHTEAQPIAQDPAVAKPAPSPTPAPTSEPAPKDAGLVDDPGAAVAEYGAPAPPPPKPPPKPTLSPGEVDDHGGMHAKYGAPPPPKPKPPSPPATAVPAYGAPPPKI